MNQHILKKIDVDIASLRSRVQQMFALNLEQFDDAVVLFEKCHRERGLAVLEREPELHQLQFALDRESTNLIALRQPSAGDLRVVIASMRIGSALEAAGNAAVAIAAAGERIHKGGRKELAERDGLGAQHLLVRGMLCAAAEAYLRQDPGALRAIAGSRQRQREQSEALLAALIGQIESRALSARVLAEEIEIVRGLDRIAALALAIALQVSYLVRGEDLRHQPLEKLAGQAV